MSAGLSLRLIGTSDLHANICAYDYYRDRPDDTVGLAKTASLDRGGARRSRQHVAVRQWRHHPGHAARRLRRHGDAAEAGDLHPMIAAMNVLVTPPARSAITSSTMDWIFSTPRSQEPTFPR